MLANVRLKCLKNHTFHLISSLITISCNLLTSSGDILHTVPLCRCRNSLIEELEPPLLCRDSLLPHLAVLDAGVTEPFTE